MIPDGAVGAPGAAESVLELRGLHVGYGKREILHGISLDVSEGEIVVLLGANGAGKSTLLKVAAGLLAPQAGTVVFCGTDITRLSAHRRARAGIAHVLQGGAVFPSLSARDHLRLAARIGRNRRRCRGGEPGLEAPVFSVDDPAGLLSGGQRQALAVATMLATEPRLLLCDEPSAGLAPRAAREVIERLVRLARERALAVLWVEHRIADVLPLVDRAVLLRRGRVIAETTRPAEWNAREVLGEFTFGASPGEPR